MILETPKGEELAEDRMNLTTMRRLAGVAPAPASKRTSTKTKR